MVLGISDLKNREGCRNVRPDDGNAGGVSVPPLHFLHALNNPDTKLLLHLYLYAQPTESTDATLITSIQSLSSYQPLLLDPVPGPSLRSLRDDISRAHEAHPHGSMSHYWR